MSKKTVSYIKNQKIFFIDQTSNDENHRSVIKNGIIGQGQKHALHCTNIKQSLSQISNQETVSLIKNQEILFIDQASNKNYCWLTNTRVYHWQVIKSEVYSSKT